MKSKISISEEVKRCAPNVSLGTIICNVKVQPSPPELLQIIGEKSREISSKFTALSLSKNPKIVAFKEAYKCFGKDPSRYRVSSEALIRRIIQGKSLYRINNVVEINNLISINSLYSVGSYDLDRLYPPIEFRLGKKGETYKGIRKNMINIENLPVFSDKEKAFGSPTSDSEGSAITMQTRNLLMFIISFSGSADLPVFIEEASKLLRRFASAQEFQTYIVK